MKLMKLEIVHLWVLYFDDDVKQVTLPGREGSLGVLPRTLQYPLYVRLLG